MFGTFFRFETRFWMRSAMLYVFLLIVALMIFGATATDQVTVGASLQNTYRNAPFVIERFYAFMGLLTLLMTTAFVNSAATRDFSSGTDQILFSRPIGKWSYLMGRFWSATLIALIPMMGVSLGIIVGKWMPWVEPERWGPVRWDAHLSGLLTMALPNTIFGAALIFAVAILTRSTITSFVASLLMLVAYGVAGALTSDLERETIAALLDPFGIRTYFYLTKYWTVTERNGLVLGAGGIMLWNRLLWLAVSMVILGVACARFEFTTRESKRRWRKRKSQETSLEDAPASPLRMRSVAQSFGATARLLQFFNQTRIEFLSTIRTTSYIVIVLASLLNCVPAIIFGARSFFGVGSLPVTYFIVDIIRGTLYMFLIALITYFAGVLVWKEREARCDEIQDALPSANWIAYTSKFLALISAIAIILLVVMGAGIAVQAYHHYARFQISLYLRELFVLDMLPFLFMTVLAFFIHVLSPNKYVGYFAFIAFLIVSNFGWRPLNVVTRMVNFGDLPGYTYSDFYGYAPFVPSIVWFAIYWSLFCALMGIATVLLWPRGRETALNLRLREAGRRFSGAVRPAAALLAVGFIAVGAWVFYNTKVLHTLRSEEENNKLSADYEKTYKKFQNLEQPRIQWVKYWIDIYPEERNVKMRAEQLIQNTWDHPIDKLHLTMTDADVDAHVEVERASLDQDDKRLHYRIYKLNPPLAPGEKVMMKYTVATHTRGFENDVTLRQVVQNGTFFNNAMVPQIGYQPGRELDNRNDRKKQKLPEKDRMPALERPCTTGCRNTYLSNNSDWVDVETVISTSPDQIAVAPGSLLREWQENGRRYFQYKLDHQSLNFYSFISARYTVDRSEWNGVKIEVYYVPEHPWNVPKMRNSVQKTLEYCSKNYAPYAHREARIIEFPRVATFAQAFPGTMPYSESIGFIANLNDPEDIDMVTYVVAHEMGHQWWAHQLVGANMQGATSLSETLAQYTALMIMEKEYGRDMMRKFLKYEMDRYLRSRGAELLKEQPLLKVEASQGYIHYQKGSVVMYYLKEMIGEEAVNRALHNMLEKYRYAPAPYPTSWALVDALRAETPADLQYLLKDLFEDITLFSNRVVEAKARKRADGKYDVTLDVEARKFKADAKGNETEVPVNDWIEIGSFGKPEKGKKYGATLYRERKHITQTRSQFTFVTAQAPDKTGIDPFLLLVDRVPGDNTKTPAIE